MFRLKHLCIDTLSEHVVFIHEAAVRGGQPRLPAARPRARRRGRIRRPAQRARGHRRAQLLPRHAGRRRTRSGCPTTPSRDLGLPEGARVQRHALAGAARASIWCATSCTGERLDRAAFDAILADVDAAPLLEGRAVDVRARLRPAHARPRRDRRLHARDDRHRLAPRLRPGADRRQALHRRRARATARRWSWCRSWRRSA